MQKKISSTTILLAVLIAMVAYYAIWVPRSTRLENSRRCSIDAASFARNYEHDVDSSAPEDSDRHWLEGESHFNSKMNACLVEIKWDEMLSDQLARAAVVVDVYSNRQIISTLDGATDLGIGGVDPKEYAVRRAQLFSE